MSKSKAIKQLDNIFSRLEGVVEETINQKAMRPLGEFIAELIRKRTRLGYGVDRDYGQKTKLKSLKASYKKFRGYADEAGFLSSNTSQGKSNLTLTGQLLDSYGIIKVSRSLVAIGPKGTRRNVGRLKGRGISNQQIALYQEEQGRIFNRLSELEFLQTVRFYRKNFGDLLHKRKLIS